MKLEKVAAGGARRHRGLTLIELMVVVAVLAIIATIAIPAYTKLMNSVRRADGRAAVTAVALAEERYFSIYQSYTASLDDLKKMAGLDADVADGDSAKGYYTVAVAGNIVGSECAIERCFTVTATAQNPDAECTAMTLTSEGNKGGSPAGTNKCWP